MAQLPTIDDIATTLYAEEDIDYNWYDSYVTGGSDDYYGYTNCFVSSFTIKYTNGEKILEISEVVGEKITDDEDSDIETHTLDYLYAIRDSADDTPLVDGTGSPEELKKVIRNFMA